MATQKQRSAARKNIRRAQAAWQKMTHREHADAQPEGAARKQPGTGGDGDYYRVVVRDKRQFKTFRTHDVGDKGHVQRLAGKRSNGSWATQAWLIDKHDAHVQNGWLQPDTSDVEGVLEKLGSKPRRQKGDVFKAKPRQNVPESDKPTPAQKQARAKNIKKAQAARHS